MRITNYIPAEIRQNARLQSKIFKAIIALGVLLIIGLDSSSRVQAQPSGMLQLNDSIHEFLLRQHTLGNLSGAHLTSLPLSAPEAIKYLQILEKNIKDLSQFDQHSLERHLGTIYGPGALKANAAINDVYTNGNDVFSIRDGGFSMAINPLAHLSIGRARRNVFEGDSRDFTTWANSRGVRFSGTLGKYMFFESRIQEVQETVINPELIEFGTYPRQRIVTYKPATKVQSDSSVSHTSRKNVLDYGPATGVVGLRTHNFEFRMGRDKNRWGHGMNSLILSNYATSYDQLQLRISAWRLQYIYLFASMNDRNERSQADGIVAEKYAVFHKLAVNVTNDTEIEVFGAIIVSEDSLSSIGLGLGLFNPILNLRQIEKDYSRLGNKIVGAGVSHRFNRGIMSYGQIILDEFVRSQIFKRNGFWANKWGAVWGVHLADLPIRNTDIRLEYSTVRPYTYSHEQSQTSFIHYNDPLGHQAGANFRSLDIFVSWSATQKLNWRGHISFSETGVNSETENFGSDPRLSYETRVADLGIKTLQGVSESRTNVESFISFELLPKLFLEAAVFYQSVAHEIDGNESLFHSSVGLRWGLPIQYRSF